MYLQTTEHSLRESLPAVNGSNIFDGSIAAPDIATDAVGTDEIATNGVGAFEIADDSIDGGELVDNSVTATDLATNSVNNVELFPGAVTSSKIAANAVGSSELTDGAVGNADLASSAVDSAKVAANSLTPADLRGADNNGGQIDLSAGGVPNWRCSDFPISVGGATAGEAVIISTQAALSAGTLISGARVPSNGTVTMKVCNLSGGTMPAIVNLPLRIITFG